MRNGPDPRLQFSIHELDLQFTLRVADLCFRNHMISLEGDGEGHTQFGGERRHRREGARRQDDGPGSCYV